MGLFDMMMIKDSHILIPTLLTLSRSSGGGHNHRMGLFDMMMIKDNHIAAAGGIKAAVQRADEYIKANGIKVGVGWCHLCAAAAGPLPLVNSSVPHGLPRGVLNKWDVTRPCRACRWRSRREHWKRWTRSSRS